ncbi:MAG: hypothetical protein HY921_10960 [Elusimicrobia bacterium]|nr:hypothetical protein [Elusimicrobiota bacterium]
MICNSCHKEQACVFIKQIVNNQVSQTALCADCARNFQASLNPFDAFLSLLSEAARPAPKPKPQSCPTCRTTFKEFQSRGRFGCPNCYERFAPLLKNIIPRIHAGAYQHRGKRPRGRD